MTTTRTEELAPDDTTSTGWQWRRRGRSRPTLHRRLALLVVVAPLLGLIGVVVAELVPDERIADRLVEAEADELIGPSVGPATPLGTTPARYTECTTFSLGLGDRPGAGLVDRAVLSATYTGCDRLRSALDEHATTGAFREGFPYLRYWHGYAVMTRPVIAVAGVAGVRWLAFALSIGAIGAMGAAVSRRCGGAAALALVGPALLTTDAVVAGLSTSTAIGGASAWFGGWLVLVAVARRPSWATAALVATVAGATSAYLDLMTTMPGALALTVAGATLGASCTVRTTTAAPWRIAVAALAGWLVGLAWMWSTKWVVAAVFLGFDEVDDLVREQIGFRLSSGADGVTDSRTGGLVDNLDEWWEQPLTPWVVIGTLAVLAVAGAIAMARRPRRAVRWDVLACALVVAVPVVAWYLAFDNHSQIHPALVHRSLPIAFGGACAVIAIAIARRRRPSVATDTATIGADPADGAGRRRSLPSSGSD